MIDPDELMHHWTFSSIESEHDLKSYYCIVFKEHFFFTLCMHVFGYLFDYCDIKKFGLFQVLKVNTK